MRKTSLLIALLAFSPVSFGADSSACMECHAADEFAGLSAADILADLQDPGIPPHKRFADLSADELQAIADELAGG